MNFFVCLCKEIILQNQSFDHEEDKFHEHQWVICVDVKTVNFLLGQQMTTQNILLFVPLGQWAKQTTG